MARKQKRPSTKKRTSAPEPAPGDLRIVHAFANTVDVRSGADELASSRSLATWLAKWGLLPEETELSEADVERARDVRAGLRGLMLSHNGGKVDAKAVARLDRAVAGSGPRLRVDRDGSVRAELLARSFEEALGNLIGLVFAAQIEGTWPRFKLCGDVACRTAFYDRSDNHVSRWCSRRCGNRMRARTFRRAKR